MTAIEAERSETDRRVLVTGAKGFIGAWIVKVLLERGVPCFMFDVDANAHRLEALLSPEQLAAVPLVRGDVAKLDEMERAVADNGITHIIHLAGLQVPFCAADPPRGALVNVLGTVNVFEAAKRHRDHVQKIAFASSVAVYGPEEFYPAGAIADTAPLQPTSHYGVYKQCNEGTARIYYSSNGLSSVGLRPSTVYGAGRDQGMTSGPTKAIKACVVGRPYTIAFTGRADMQYVRDTADTFIATAFSSAPGAKMYNPRGAVVSTDQILAVLGEVFPEAAQLIQAQGKPLPIPSELDDAALRRDFPDLPHTSLEDGVRETAEIFRELQRQGRLNTHEMDA